MKLSEIFEGENSSLKRTFDEAVTPHPTLRDEYFKEFKKTFKTYFVGNSIPEEVFNFFITWHNTEISSLKSRQREGIEKMKKEAHCRMNQKDLSSNCPVCLQIHTHNATLDSALSIIDTTK